MRSHLHVHRPWMHVSATIYLIFAAIHWSVRYLLFIQRINLNSTSSLLPLFFFLSSASERANVWFLIENAFVCCQPNIATKCSVYLSKIVFTSGLNALNCNKRKNKYIISVNICRQQLIIAATKIAGNNAFISMRFSSSICCSLHRCACACHTCTCIRPFSGYFFAFHILPFTRSLCSVSRTVLSVRQCTTERAL